MTQQQPTLDEAKFQITKGYINVANSLAGEFTSSSVAKNVETRIASLLFGVGIGYAKLRSSVVHESVYKPQVGSYTPDENFEDNGGVVWDGKMSKALFNIPVLCHLTINGGSYTTLDGKTITLPTIDFETVLISVKGSKNIEKTEINGRNFSIKESIAMKDYSIEIRAVIAANVPVSTKDMPNGVNIQTTNNITGVYPYSNMEQIVKVLEAPIALPIDCWFLSHLFNINYIVIEDYDVNQVEGEYSTQILSMQAVSDSPLIIKVAQ